MPERKFTGGCQCGAVRYEVTADPVAVAYCHCSNCRRANAAAGVAWAMFQEEHVHFQGEAPKTYASTEQGMRGFCGNCGTQISFKGEFIPGLIDMTVGSFDDPEALPPTMHIWDCRRPSWVDIGAGLPRFEEFPPFG